MSSLTLDGRIRYAEVISKEIDRAKLIINGEVKEKQFYRKKVEGGEITILIYLRGRDVGIVEQLELVAEDGTVLHRKADIIKKDGTEGFLIGFKFHVRGASIE